MITTKKMQSFNGVKNGMKINEDKHHVINGMSEEKIAKAKALKKKAKKHKKRNKK